MELASAGYDVAVHYGRSADEATPVARQIEELGRRACLIQGDLSATSSWGRIVASCVEALGRLDVLVNNAAVFEPLGLAARRRGSEPCA